MSDTPVWKVKKVDGDDQTLQNAITALARILLEYAEHIAESGSSCYKRQAEG